VAYEVGGRHPPRLEKFRTKSVFQGKRKLFKILNNKKYQYSEFRAHSVFQGKCKLFKILNDEIYIQYNEFRAHSLFQGKRKLLKILHDKKCICNTVNSGQTLILNVSESCLKF